LIDCGIEAAGGLEAGRQLAEICLAGLAKVQIVDEPLEAGVGPSVAVRTDHPVAACMASQYAGWQVSLGDYFAMGSGPMRAARGKENLFDEIGLRESPSEAVGVLESSQPPPAEVCAELARECGVLPEKLTLLVAPTASQAGTI